MFSEKKVEQNLDRLEAGMKFRPVFHTLGEVDEWTQRLATAFDRQANGTWRQTRDLTRPEHEFIRNERLACAASCRYFLTRYFWIKADNNIFRFTFRRGQEVLWQMLCHLDEMGKAKMLQVLKARKLGISTLAEGIGAWECLFVPGVQAQIGSCDGQKTQIMFGMILFAMGQLPPWLPPTQTRAKIASDRALVEFRYIGSNVVIQPGSMRGGMGQGDSPTYFHLAEVSQFPTPVQTIEEGLLRALRPSPILCGFLESTGDVKNKSAQWWKNLWIFNRDNYWKEDKGALLLPVFLPWHTTPELYPGDGFLHDHPVPERWQPNPSTMATVAKAEAYVQTTEMLRKVIGDQWRMPREQQWYWEFNYEAARARGMEKSWIRQMPNDDDDALLGNFDKVYSKDTIEIVSKSSALPAMHCRLSGPGIKPLPSRAVPAGGKPIVSRWMRGETPMEFTFSPVHPFEGDEGLATVAIFEAPLPGAVYSIAVDTSSGVGRDRMVATVTRKGAPDVQAAEFASDRVPEGDAFLYVLALLALYGEHTTNGEHPILIIELSGSHGDLTIHNCRKAGAWNFYRWGKGFSQAIWKEHAVPNPAAGWKMASWSRQLLLEAFQHAVSNGWYQVRSQWAARELAGIEEHVTASGKDRADHAEGEHDDRVIAMAMGHWALHESDDFAMMAASRCEPEDEIVLPEIAVEGYYHAVTKGF